MPQKSCYTVHVFDRKNNYLGLAKEAPLSKAFSYDIYLNDKFVFGDYFDSRLKVSQKLSLTRRIINIVKKQILKKKAEKKAKKSPKEFRKQTFMLPPNFDVMLFGTNGRRVKSNQLSKAKYFKILTKIEDNKKWTTIGDWQFPSGLKVKEKIDIIKEFISETSTKTVIPIEDLEPEVDTEEEFETNEFDYTVFREENKTPFVTAKGDDSRAVYRTIKFNTPIGIELENRSLPSFTQDPLSEIIAKEHNKEFDIVESFPDGTKHARFRAEIEYVNPVTGELTSKWISTGRQYYKAKSAFSKFFIPAFMQRLGRMLDKYINASFSEMSISKILLETEIPNE